VTRYLLDTNILSETQKARPNPGVAEWLGGRTPRELVTCAIVLGEIWQGILELPDGARKQDYLRWFAGRSGPPVVFAGRILPFDDAAALEWGALLAEGRRLGRPRSAIDMQIAAIAKVSGCVLVTRNLRHYASVAHVVDVLDPARPGS
jgi:predicted nucleic acid-binding protein